jgi:rfaE bifunctional protein kinase chain/domain
MSQDRLFDVSACRSALDGFAGKRVLVIGDLMLDEHIWGSVARVSPEAPVMVVEVNSHPSDNRPGGAANVANNILALGGEAVVVGVVGDDEGGRILTEYLARAGADVGGIVIDKDRPTTRKTRIWASRRHQVVRVDLESKKKVGGRLAREIMSKVESCIDGADAVLISDYDKGLVTIDISQGAIQAARARGVVTSANPKPRNLHHYAGASVITLNQHEAALSAQMDIDGMPKVERAGKKILSSSGCEGLVITRGAAGLSVFDGSNVPRHIPAIESEVYDVAGAGDTVVSALTMAMSCGLDLANSAAIANCSGGAVVRKVGVATTSVEEIAQLLQEI